MTKSRAFHSAWRWAAPLLSLVVLAAMASQPLLHGKPRDADAYHARVRAASSSVPLTIGDWRGTDVAIPQAAIKLLRPNVAISRDYRNIRTGATVQMLLMQCEDARDLSGHYPPNCYPGNGWTLVAQRPTTWVVKGMTIGGEEYEFVKHRAVQQGHIFAANFLILPNGSFVRDMSQFQRLAFDYRTHYYGAAQIQLVFDGDTLPEDRHSGVVTFVGACEPLIQVIRSGCTQ